MAGQKKKKKRRHEIITHCPTITYLGHENRKEQWRMKKKKFFFFCSPIMSFVFGGSYIFFVVCPVVTISLSLSSRMIIDDDCSKLSSSSHFSMTSASECVSTFFYRPNCARIRRGEEKSNKKARK